MRNRSETVRNETNKKRNLTKHQCCARATSFSSRHRDVRHFLNLSVSANSNMVNLCEERKGWAQKRDTGGKWLGRGGGRQQGEDDINIKSDKSEQ